MNERIKGLMTEAFDTAEYPADQAYRIAPNPAFCSKFAELIVKECLDVVAMRMNLGPIEICRQECKAIAAEIKQHFGVE